MSDSLKEFQRKIKNRQFAIDNSWRGVKCIAENDRHANTSEEECLWRMLDQNISEADATKTFDGYLPLYSHRKIFGGAFVFCKKALRKLLKIFWGWYIFPFYERLSHFHGKTVNAVSIQRDLIAKLGEQLAKSRQMEESLTAQVSQLISAHAELLEQVQEMAAKLNAQATQLVWMSASQMEAEASQSMLCQKQSETELSLSTLRHKQEEDKTIVREHLVSLDSQLKKLENLPTDDDDFYHDFEEKFRGSADEIRERLRVYVPVIQEHLADWSKGRFVDVGSGRGEWLDILRENRATDYVGVDLNERQNAICADGGHQTVCMDCIQYLEEQPEGSVDLVTGFQIIEHLAMSDLMELLRQSYRALKPGGMILFETQNPRNLIVGADTFYIDPSHKRPLPPEMVAFFVEWSGFGQVRCIDANSYPNWEGVLPTEENQPQHELIQQFNDVCFKLYGPQDYAIFAVKE